MSKFSGRVIALLIAVFGGLALTQPLHAATKIKIATLAPEGSDWMKKMRAGGKEIKTLTDGRVELKFYGGGVMGNDKKVLRKMRIGQLHGGAFTAAGLAERYKDIQLYGLPLLFQSQAEVDHVREAMDDRIEAGLAKVGLRSFGLASGGFAVMMSNEPVRSLDDLRGKKVWVPEGDAISYATMKRLGLAPVVLPLTDVLTGLQTGLIDIIGSSPVAAVVLQWHTKVKFVSELPVSYVFATLVIDEKILARLSDEDQKIVADVMRAVYLDFEKNNRIDDVKAADALRTAGLKFVPPESGQVPEWRASSAKIRRELATEGEYSAELLDEIEQLLTNFRASSAAAAQ